MKALLFPFLIFGFLFPSLAFAQAAAKAGPGDQIVRFYIETGGNGALHIVHADGSEAVIVKEKGRFAVGNQTVGQSEFSRIQLADDRRRIGWLADYMICQQSYPCPVELVVYQPGRKLTQIAPPYGIFWRWTFVEGGGKIAVEAGYPHGDQTGLNVLYDSETGRELARFTPTEGEGAPDWVQTLRRSE